MKLTLTFEYLGGLLLALCLFSGLQYSWWLYLTVFLTPDFGMIGYLISPRAGAATYNVVHHLGVGALCYVSGAMLHSPLLQLAGTVIMGHLFFDRLLGYGLKYPDAFKHTHLSDG